MTWQVISEPLLKYLTYKALNRQYYSSMRAGMGVDQHKCQGWHCCSHMHHVLVPNIKRIAHAGRNTIYDSPTRAGRQSTICTRWDFPACPSGFLTGHCHGYNHVTCGNSRSPWWYITSEFHISLEEVYLIMFKAHRHQMCNHIRVRLSSD